VAVALKTDPPTVLRGPLDVVEHRPHTSRGVGTGDLDLGHVTVMHGTEALHDRADAGDDLVASSMHQMSLGDLEDRVDCEDSRPGVPLLRVDEAEVTSLELLDLLDVEQHLHVCIGAGHEFSMRSKAASIATRRCS
jgi:hypothetical protein